MAMPASTSGSGAGIEATLRGVVEPLATLIRRAGSRDEERAARMLVEAFERVGTTARVDEVRFRDGYARLLMPLALAGLVAGLRSSQGHRRPAWALLAGAATAALVDDVENGKRLWRRTVRRPRTTWNVVAQAGDASAGRTLVVLAHHDAAPTGRVFDPSFQRWLAKRFPDLVQRTDTGIPLWWSAAAGPGLAGLGAATGSRVLSRVGAGLSALNLALGADIARNRIVPGANDNLSGVAALVALAERLGDQPISGLRVVLASCGAEEVLQGGIYSFVDGYLKPLDPRCTWVLNLDTIGSPELVMLEGEGPFWMHDYTDSSFRDLLADVARRVTGAPLRRGVRARASTDAIVPSRAGYPTATLVSWEPDTKLQSNYHLPTDVPENLRYGTVATAVTIAEALAQELAAAHAPTAHPRPGRVAGPTASP
jgi:Peptidase family M28